MKIKSLEWVKIRNDMHMAETFYGLYRAWRIGENYTYLSCYDRSGGKIDCGAAWNCADVDDAKVKAQAIHIKLMETALEE